MQELTKTDENACVENGAVPIPLLLLVFYPRLLKLALETTALEAPPRSSN